MCIYIYIYRYRYWYRYTYRHIYIYIHVHTHRYLMRPRRVPRQIMMVNANFDCNLNIMHCKALRADTHNMYIFIYLYVCICIIVSLYIYIYIYMYMHTCMCIYIYMYIYILYISSALNRPPSQLDRIHSLFCYVKLSVMLTTIIAVLVVSLNLLL